MPSFVLLKQIQHKHVVNNSYGTIRGFHQANMIGCYVF